MSALDQFAALNAYKTFVEDVKPKFEPKQGSDFFGLRWVFTKDQELNTDEAELVKAAKKKAGVETWGRGDGLADSVAFYTHAGRDTGGILPYGQIYISIYDDPRKTVLDKANKMAEMANKCIAVLKSTKLKQYDSLTTVTPATTLKMFGKVKEVDPTKLYVMHKDTQDVIAGPFKDEKAGEKYIRKSLGKDPDDDHPFVVVKPGEFMDEDDTSTRALTQFVVFEEKMALFESKPQYRKSSWASDGLMPAYIRIVLTPEQSVTDEEYDALQPALKRIGAGNDAKTVTSRDPFADSVSVMVTSPSHKNFLGYANASQGQIYASVHDFVRENGRHVRERTALERAKLFVDLIDKAVDALKSTKLKQFASLKGVSESEVLRLIGKVKVVDPEKLYVMHKDTAEVIAGPFKDEKAGEKYILKSLGKEPDDDHPFVVVKPGEFED